MEVALHLSIETLGLFQLLQENTNPFGQGLRKEQRSTGWCSWLPVLKRKEHLWKAARKGSCQADKKAFQWFWGHQGYSAGSHWGCNRRVEQAAEKVHRSMETEIKVWFEEFVSAHLVAWKWKPNSILVGKNKLWQQNGNAVKGTIWNRGMKSAKSEDWTMSLAKGLGGKVQSVGFGPAVLKAFEISDCLDWRAFLMMEVRDSVFRA